MVRERYFERLGDRQRDREVTIRRMGGWVGGWTDGRMDGWIEGERV